MEPAYILNQRETMIQNQVISQVKVQWKHLELDEATWKLEDAMWEAYHFRSSFENIEDSVILRGRGI